MEFYPHQLDAAKRLKTGSILWGGVGSGKSLTALLYYQQNESDKALYIITTAKKRDAGEWLKEAEMIDLPLDPITVDSWNNIKKYVNVENGFFVFDEQRLVGSGAWVRSFLKIVKKNEWILLSATPGDTWMDYIPVFIANGFYRNRTHFIQRHVVYNPFVVFPKVDKYLEEDMLELFKQLIMVEMKHESPSISKSKIIEVEYDKEKYGRVVKTLWNPFTELPIRNASELCFTLRKIVNSDPSRLGAVLAILEQHERVIVFYNFNYELDILRTIADLTEACVAEYNGHKHEPIPDTRKWVYLVQYTAGAEGWNCVETNVVLFYSLNYSYKTMKQAAGRIDRINTTFATLFYYYLRSTSSIDNAINKRLKKKKNFNESYFYSHNKQGLL